MVPVKAWGDNPTKVTRAEEIPYLDAVLKKCDHEYMQPFWRSHCHPTSKYGNSSQSSMCERGDSINL